MKLQEEKVYEEDKKIFGIYERRKRNRGRGGDFDSNSVDWSGYYF